MIDNRENNIYMPKIKGLKDAPIQIHDDDALGLSDYAKALSAFILSADTPITIGIHGDWGSGKSSLMYLIEQKIKTDCLWFNAWQFSQFNTGEQLSIPLLSHFIDEMERLGGTQASLEAAKKALRGVMADTENRISKNIRDLNKEISKLVAETLKNATTDRIIVFIDDIDRLVPEKALDLLETMKLFLDIKGCVFVLACDKQVVAQGLKQKHKFNPSEKDIKGFFEKLIQVQFKMPTTQYNAQGFIMAMLNEHLGVTYTSEQDKSDDAALYLKLIIYSAGFNPRTVKRLFNKLLLLKLVLEAKDVLKSDQVSDVNEKMRILFATLCLQHSFPTMYNNLLSYLHDVGEAENVTGEKVTETNQFFRELRKSETFRQEEEGEFAEKNVGNAYQLANFMGAFFDAIQLKSDTSENAEDLLNANEIVTLHDIMLFLGPIVGAQPPPSLEWTGYWFVNVADEDRGYRTWEDNRTYGFLSAGHSLAFERLSVGDKIYAYTKGRGYVGFGEVTKEAVRVKEFMAPNKKEPLPAADKNSDNEEWVVGVKWKHTVPTEQAKTFDGIFANQNVVVCKLRHEQTLRFVRKHFGK